jgi:hypothetical protein
MTQDEFDRAVYGEEHYNRLKAREARKPQLDHMFELAALRREIYDLKERLEYAKTYEVEYGKLLKEKFDREQKEQQQKQQLRKRPLTARRREKVVSMNSYRKGE